MSAIAPSNDDSKIVLRPFSDAAAMNSATCPSGTPTKSGAPKTYVLPPSSVTALYLRALEKLITSDTGSDSASPAPCKSAIAVDLLSFVSFMIVLSSTGADIVSSSARVSTSSSLPSVIVPVLSRSSTSALASISMP